MMLNGTSSVRQWVRDHPEVARVFEEVRVDYCCSGQATLAEACRDSGLNLEDVLARLRSAIAEPGALPAENWDGKSLGELCDHIESTHHAFLRDELPRLASLVVKVAQAHGAAHPELAELKDVFNSLRAELEPHMFKEERILFPAIRRLEASDDVPRFGFGSLGNPIHVMEDEHQSAGDALRRMRELTLDFQAPPDACDAYRGLMTDLRGLERDLHAHIHKENNILFPRAAALEASK